MFLYVFCQKILLFFYSCYNKLPNESFDQNKFIFPVGIKIIAGASTTILILSVAHALFLTKNKNSFRNIINKNNNVNIVYRIQKITLTTGI